MLVAALLAPPAAAPQASRPQPQPAADQPAERLARPGLPNLGRVTPALLRGAQPTAAGFDELRKLGVEVVVDLNTSRKHIKKERALVETRGMLYVSLPWSAFSHPEDAQVSAFLRLVRRQPAPKVFVHCKHGADRTGTFIALYRIAEHGWTPQQALEEMESFHFHGRLYGHLKRYIRAFPARAAAEPSLTGRPAAETTGRQ